MVSSNITIEIDSKRCNKTFEVLRFTEFDVMLDLETDSDQFDLVAENPNGIYTGLFCRFDDCRLKVNGKTIMCGMLDCVDYFLSPDKDYIKISGRDLVQKLVDNDALPDTLQNINPKTYTEKKCKEYGIKCNAKNADIYKKLVIGCQESEISIINNILLDSKQRVWYLVDTLYTGNWGTNKKPSHLFSMSKSTKGIPIMQVEYKEDGTDMISKLLVYGSDDNGKQKVMGSYSNPFLSKKKIQKREVRRHYSDKAASKYTSVAEREVRENFRDDTELKIVVPIRKSVYLPNTVATVDIDRIGLNDNFFIKSVHYTKGIDDGGTATITMIPADDAFEKLWKSSTAITLTKYTALSKKLANGGKKSTNNGNKSSNKNKKSSTSSSSKYFEACEYTGNSIIDGLKSIGVDSSSTYRAKIAKANNITGYRGSAAQNTKMLNLLKVGKLIKP